MPTADSATATSVNGSAVQNSTRTIELVLSDGSWYASVGVAVGVGVNNDMGTVCALVKMSQGRRALVFVNGLPEDVVAKGFKWQLRDLFAPFGAQKVSVAVNSDNLTRGWAHVTLKDEAQVPEAIDALDGKAEVTYQKKDGSDVDKAEGDVEEAASTKVKIRVSRTLGRVDFSFSRQPFCVRSQLRVDDHEAYVSLTDDVTADRMAAVIEQMIDAAFGPKHGILVVDATAGAGGNTAAFAARGRFGPVHAIELDDKRASILQDNLRVLGHASSVRVHHGDAVALLSSATQQLCLPDDVHVLFLDPPWGGTTYSASSAISDLFVGELGMKGLCDLVNPRLHHVQGGAHFSADLVALKLPSQFDLDSLARHATQPLSGDTRGQLDERAFPFVIEFGKTTLLLIAFPRDAFAPPPTAAAAAAAASFCNASLDRVIAALNAFSTTCGHRKHPRFFDWEKQRWINLSRWKGCNMQPALKK